MDCAQPAALSERRNWFMGDGGEVDGRADRRLRNHQQEVDGEMLYEIGYHLRRDQWGQGFATEAAQACKAWGFANLSADRIISLIRPENLPSRRVAERNGMTLWKEIEWRGLAALCVFGVPGKPAPTKAVKCFSEAEQRRTLLSALS